MKNFSGRGYCFFGFYFFCYSAKTWSRDASPCSRTPTWRISDLIPRRSKRRTAGSRFFIVVKLSTRKNCSTSGNVVFSQKTAVIASSRSGYRLPDVRRSGVPASDFSNKTSRSFARLVRTPFARNGVFQHKLVDFSSRKRRNPCASLFRFQT